ncbi:glycosyltransferase [Vibrio rhodolitus]|uniref:glycosyltransferase n=1 Tax=Vibrio rhodolitus TaxID=2231649 RepID=UPI000E0A6149|nr:glycosyltransferase [Vibrio rhodolitus]
MIRLGKYFYFVRRFIFEISCIFYDVISLLSTYKRSKEKKIASSEVVFICSRDFFFNKKWQVASQKDLWFGFVNETSALVCGSCISYYLFGKRKKYVVSLEPRWNAPKVRFSKIHRRVLVTVSDSHSKKWLPKYLARNNITHIVTPYKKTLLQTGYHGKIPEECVISFPWCVADDVLTPPNVNELKYEVLGFGKTEKNIYDLRMWAFNSGLLDSFDYAGSGNKKFTGSNYFEWLGNYDACVVAVSSNELYNITVAKYFEIPSQGLLLFAFETVDLVSFGFKDGVNCVFVNKENFNAKICDYKNRPEYYIDIRRNGYKLIKENHTVSKRIASLKQLVLD